MLDLFYPRLFQMWLDIGFIKRCSELNFYLIKKGTYGQIGVNKHKLARACRNHRFVSFRENFVLVMDQEAKLLLY